jgi:hypothetical protein
MTDFFADLEAEIRAAHPRRSKPAVPVRAFVTAVTVVAALAAVATFAPSAEREVAQQPAPAPTGGWTAYAPAESVCAPVTHTGEVPQVLLDNFTVLRSGEPPADPPSVGYSDSVKYVYERGIRVVRPDIGPPVAVVPVRLSCAKGKTSPGVCVVRLDDPADVSCAGGGETFGPDFMMSQHDAAEDGGMIVTVLATDASFDRINISGGEVLASDPRPKQNLLVVRVASDDPSAVKVSPSEVVPPVPSGPQCRAKFMSGPAPSALLDRFGVLRRPGDAGDWKGGVPGNAARYFTDGARKLGSGKFEVLVLPVEFAKDDCEHFVPGVCLIVLSAAEGEACTVLSEGDDPMLAVAVVEDDPEHKRVFVLAEDSLERIHCETRSPRRVEHSLELSPQNNWFAFESDIKSDEKVVVRPAS